MKQFKFYENPLGEREAVKLGWSWPAFFFAFFWALCKKLHKIAIAMVVIPLAVGTLLSMFVPLYGYALYLFIGHNLIYIYIGCNGNLWRQENLYKRGFRYMATIEAPNPKTAIAIYQIEKGLSDQSAKSKDQDKARIASMVKKLRYS